MALNTWNDKIYGCSFAEAKTLAKELGISFELDYESCRSAEGFYALEAGITLSEYRIKYIADYADIVWMETPDASVKVGADLSGRVRKFNKNILLGYNLSPSFNWS